MLGRNDGQVERIRTELRDRALGFALIRHFDEAETTRSASLAIHEDLDRRNFPEGSEGIAKLGFAHAVGQISDVDVHHRHSHVAAHTTSDSIGDVEIKR